MPLRSISPSTRVRFASRLTAGSREGSNLALAHDIGCFIIEASDLVLRLTVEQLRQETDDFVDTSKALVIKTIKEALNSVSTDTPLNANKVANTVTMLSCIKQISIP